jgi:hypothetical protein
MKKTLLTAAIALGAFAASAQSAPQPKAEKLYTIQLTETQINNLANALQFGRQNLPLSDAPARGVVEFDRNAKPIIDLLIAEYQRQSTVADTTKKQPAVKPKKQ